MTVSLAPWVFASGFQAYEYLWDMAACKATRFAAVIHSSMRIRVAFAALFFCQNNKTALIIKVLWRKDFINPKIKSKGK